MPFHQTYTPTMNEAIPSSEEQHSTIRDHRAVRTQTQFFLVISLLFGSICIAIAEIIRSHRLPVDPSRYSDGNLRLKLNPPYVREIILLLLNLTFVKLSARASGLAHEMSLKWELAFEDDKLTEKPRLEFNSNMRFLQSSYKWWSVNGFPVNVVMAICLTITYAASSMVLLGMEEENGAYNAILSFVALYVLGFAVLTQSTIACIAIHTTEIPTWSQSPLTTASVLIQMKRLKRRPGRCMHALCDLHRAGPRKPREYQESLWVSHPQFRRFTAYIWMVVAAFYYWAFIIWGMTDSGTQGSSPGNDWDLIPSSAFNSSSPKSKVTGLMNFGWEGEAPTVGILWGLGILVGFQGGMITTALKCGEATDQIVIDEYLWRQAGSGPGADHSAGILKRLTLSILPIQLELAEPFIHWLFGLAVGVSADVGFQIRPVQMFYVALVLTIGAVQQTVLGKYYRPRTCQPSTYGHLQTLVDLIDVWHDKMYWGHKGDGHAGTSDNSLPRVNLEEEYGFCDRDDC